MKKPAHNLVLSNAWYKRMTTDTRRAHRGQLVSVAGIVVVVACVFAAPPLLAQGVNDTFSVDKGKGQDWPDSYRKYPDCQALIEQQRVVDRKLFNANLEFIDARTEDERRAIYKRERELTVQRSSLDRQIRQCGHAADLAARTAAPGGDGADNRPNVRPTTENLNPSQGPLQGGLAYDVTDQLPPDFGERQAVPGTHRAHVSPPFLALNDFMENISDYNMTKPHTGAKVMFDSLTDMALGYLLKPAAAALKKLYGAAAENIAKHLDDLLAKTPEGGTVSLDELFPPPSSGRSALPDGKPGVGVTPETPHGSGWGNQAPGSYDPLKVSSWDNLPPGVELPPVVRNTPRPRYEQQTEMSCGLACVKMIAETVNRKSLPESFYRALSRGDLKKAATSMDVYDPLRGTQPTSLADVLKLANVSNSGVQSGVTLDMIAQRTASGYPALVGLRSGTVRHGIVVDAVVEHAGTRYIVTRNPVNLSKANSQTAQMFAEMGYDGREVLTEHQFLQRVFDFQNGLTDAIFTNPL